MTLDIQPSGQTCGATVRGIDLSGPLTNEQIHELRAAWLTHQVISLPDQQLTPETMLALADRLGPASDDPYLVGLQHQPRVVEVRREPDEKARIFADNWHSDWSFLPSPPSATLLYGIEIPPAGGDTLFENLTAACEALGPKRRAELSQLRGVHSARLGYARNGRYGIADAGRSMNIRSSDSALATQEHPLIRRHPETGRDALFISPAYTIGIAGLSEQAGRELLDALFQHCQMPEFVYRHQWQAGMLTMWDNRCLNHRATGGYEGHRRLLHRVTVGEPAAHA